MIVPDLIFDLNFYREFRVENFFYFISEGAENSV